MNKAIFIVLFLSLSFASGSCEKMDPCMEREIVFFVEGNAPKAKRPSVDIKRKVSEKLKKIEQELLKYSTDDEFMIGVEPKLKRLKSLIEKGKYREANSYANEMLKELM